MPTEAGDSTRPLADLVGRPYSVDLGPGPEPGIVLRRLARMHTLGALWGRWFGGGVVLVWNPFRTRAARQAPEAHALLDDQPVLNGPVDGLGGGWLTCLGYAESTSWVAFHDHLLRLRPDGRWVFESLGLAGREVEQEAALTQSRDAVAAAGMADGGPAYRVGTFTSLEPETDVQSRHVAAVEQAIGRIDRGDFYQMNLCTRLTAPFHGSAADLFADVATSLQPDYAALVIRDDGTAVASMSPELFLSVHGGEVTTAPIKGTSPRDADPTGTILRSSAKDAAENIMITDLMRNDLSRVCRPGTVRVASLLGLEPHPGVWHLVSRVTGALRSDTSTSALLEATYPPGSVTGAPKISAIRAIADLEPQSRGAYTGAIGLVTPQSGTELNVIIRSFEIDDDRIELGVGGGITVDSVPVREWYECLHKAAPLVQAAGARLAPRLRASPPPVPTGLLDAGVIETLLVVGGVVQRLEAHLARLDRSCRELYGLGVPEDLSPDLRRLAADHPTERLGLRVTVRPWPTGLEVRTEFWPLGPRPTRCSVVLGERPAWSWRHKWADRSALTDAERRAGPDHPYFIGPDGHVAETSRGNLFYRGGDGVWRTPPADEHLLPGVTRREVLDVMAELGVPARLEQFGPDHLRRATAAFWTSSLSGLVPVASVDGRRLDSADLPAELSARLAID